ncbi:efflux transporter, outer membrane factor (OMF) lipoprotein, NodT family [Roseateles sp. YR242]|uniref:efflux transporter outer membrane subunit n=1 Tax=Roseateles sp. YR242 TaxID=1855305 RepID=UPI0008D71CE6|nr:efflux transporter outer membrane subunit [Roseateles sp. YR242]SEK68148.1 efflux transporter, outer membrane factor (OMF) lipoprotein, NodT family [Roseateles sp. YR242]
MRPGTAALCAGLFAGLFAMTAAGLSGCAPVIRPAPEAAHVAIPASWRNPPASAVGASAAPASSLPTPAGADSATAAARHGVSPWWESFQDPVLNALVDRALDHNSDLLLAGARWEEARAALGASRAAEGPAGNLQLPYQASRTLQVTGISQTHLVQPTLAASWELDLWGRSRDLTRSAELRLQASEAERQGAALSVSAATVQSYVAMLALDAQLALSRATLASRQEALRLAQDQARVGYISQLQLTQAQAEYASVAQAIPQLALAIRRQEQALALLVGDTAREQPRGLAFDRMALPAPPASMPSALLERRPDLVQAARQLAATDATLAARRSAFLPQVNLSATAGKLYIDALDYDPIRVWSIGASVLAPLFDAGRLQAQFDAATAQRDQAAFNYRARVLTALAEVENALAGLDRLAEQRRYAMERRDVLARSLQYAHDRYEAGYAGYLEELDAQRNLFAQDNELIRLRQAELENRIALIRALGGAPQ